MAPWAQAGSATFPVVTEPASLHPGETCLNRLGEYLPEIGVQADPYAGLTRVPRRTLGRCRPPCPGDSGLESHHGRVVGAGDIDDEKPGFGDVRLLDRFHICLYAPGRSEVLHARPIPPIESAATTNCNAICV